jgi:hypothetical protein
MVVPPSSDSHPRPDATAGDAATPDLGLGPTLVPQPFAPGRFASVVQRRLRGTHQLQLVTEDSTASFLLELAADGGATACRGWSYQGGNDGPNVHGGDRFDEQQGYRGRHTQQGGMVEVELTSDDTVCPPRHDFGTLALARSPTIKLRCALVAPRGHAYLTAPALVCRWIDVRTQEAPAHLVTELVPGGWMVLGGGNGLVIKVTGEPAGARSGSEPTVVRVEPAPAPLAADAWQRSY